MKSYVDNKAFFEKFNKTLIYTVAAQFYLRRCLQKKENTEKYNELGYFRQVVIPTLHQWFILNLAHVFDWDDKTFSLYSYLKRLPPSEEQKYMITLNSKKYESVINNLRRWRDKYLAHKEEKFIFDGLKLTDTFPLKYQDIEELLELLIDIVDKSKSFFDEKDITDYKKYYVELEKWCENDSSAIVKNIRVYKS